MDLIFNIGQEGRKLSLLPGCDVETVSISDGLRRNNPPKLPQLSENEISRHYTKLAERTHGVNNGFYPLGSCTMKYNPKVNEETASLEGFAGIHPLQKESTVQGCLEVTHKISQYLCEITGMDNFTMQPAAGAHGEFTGLLLIKAYHVDRGDMNRKKIIVPDSAHGTNPASAAMCGFDIVSIPSSDDGCVDIEALREAVGYDTAGLMLTNPNTLGIFDKNITEITKIVHEAGGLCYYDGANLNAVMGIVRPGDMGFDCVHVNIHKTFSTPHGGGGPGSGPVGCKALLAPYLPGTQVSLDENGDCHYTASEKSTGAVKQFHGNFLVNVRALTYLLTLGREGIPEASSNAVLNANYMRVKLADTFDIAYPGTCMHEFVMSLENFKKETGCSALDVAKGLLDYGMHPPTMYFPLIVHEALMIEPTETEPKEVLDRCIEALKEIHAKAHEDPEHLKGAPHNTVIGRPDEVTAARNPILCFSREV
ncbi:MAG: aminomethyl-transferring glycine dehydrogenase subunit GcvPB [Hornefia sp.]|nr:aminomethyl-transferring glycine dehydrogenase subunit GcvPB [Hornefia sp.]